MRVIATALPEVLVVEPDVFRDARGYFLETYHELKYAAGGIATTFRQHNRSRSVYGTIRGLHIQPGRPQGKLVQAIAGSIFDVAVDLRADSPTFGAWVGVTLSAENFRQCYVPPGFAHGFCVTSAFAEVEYKCTELYDPAAEVGIAWNDPELAIAWPITEPVLSERDRLNPMLADALGAAVRPVR